MNFTIIIPVYFNEGTLLLTHKKIAETLQNNPNVENFDFIFIDDGSKDGSLNELLSLKQLNGNISIIKFTRNFGQVPAIYSGYMYAKGDAIITLSADLQDPPELISEMIDTYCRGEAEIVICSRTDREESGFRKATSRLFYTALKKLSFANMPDGGFDFVLIGSKAHNHIKSFNETNIFWQGQILWMGFPVKFIPYVRQKRTIGKSRWTLSKKIKYLLDGVLGYSFFPIRLISIMGILIFISGLIYTIILVLQYLLGDAPFKGWTPIMIAILLSSGFQMLMLGIIGEYLWRTLEQVRNRPLYIIDKIY